MDLIHCSWNSLRRCWPYSLVVALAVFVSLSPTTLAGGEQWTVTAVEGSAMVIDTEHGTRDVQPGLRLGAGSTIVTGEDGTIALDREADSIVVFPSSSATIPATATTGAPDILQEFGQLLYQMESRDSWDFQVRTPYLVATVKGTTFTVTVERSSAMVSVAEGMVQVDAARDGRSVMVGAGRQATVTGDGDNPISVEPAASKPDVPPAGQGRRLGNFGTQDSGPRGAESQGDDGQDSGSVGGSSQGGSAMGGNARGDQQ